MKKIFIFLLISGLLLTGCLNRTPPSKEKIHAVFQKSYSDIHIITQYLLSSKYNLMFYPTSDGKLFADFERLPLDPSIKDAVHSLIKGRKVIQISKNFENNAIVFEMWTDQMECECGIVYAINNGRKPTVQYLTLLKPLPETGWYYYVSDYNEWRRNNP